MNTLQTFKFWLEPDRDIPQFRRLRWALEPVSIRDVLLQGIHPWGNHNQHYTLPDAVLAVINNEAGHLPELEQFRYCYNICVPPGFAWNTSTKFERTLQAIHENLIFVDELSYLKLLDIAKDRLRRQWSHALARDMAHAACPGFQELRRFLKNKDKRLKLSGYEDVDRYDLGKVLTLDDFNQRDSLIISTAIPTLNFRKASVLQQITDGQGRLRLAPHIRHLMLTETAHPTHDDAMAWCVSGEGNTWRFRPDLGDFRGKRSRAEAFAKRWRTDTGSLCFTTTLDNLVAMVEANEVQPGFPSLNYTAENRDWQRTGQAVPVSAFCGPENTATATVHGAEVQAFHIGPYPRRNVTGETLKDILRYYSVPMTGNKEKLLEKLAALAATKYAEHLPELDRFFSKHRFLRMRSAPNNTKELPLLENLVTLRNLVLTIYAIKHLRGDTLLEADHLNNTYTEEELAHALITGKTDLNGAFLRVM